MQESDPTVAYSYVLKSHPRGGDNTESIENSCNRPYRAATIDAYTNCMLCICDGWVPVPVGEITDFDQLEQIWDNPIAHSVQRSVDDKKFTWCAVQHCGVKQRSIIEHSYKLVLGIDDSCNLHCPSCRRELIMHSSGPLFDKKLRAVEHTVKLLEKFQPRIHITLASSGDPLASHIYRPLLHSYQAKPSQTFTLFTNGLLIKKQLDKTALRSQITLYQISVDAGSADVYHTVRRGGVWSALMENFEYLATQRGSATVLLCFVVQNNNFRDMENFIDVCQRFGFKGSLTQLDDWGTWNRTPSPTPDAWEIKNGTFVDNDVLDPAHQNYSECQGMVKSIQQRQLNNISFSPRLLQLLNL